MNEQQFIDSAPSAGTADYVALLNARVSMYIVDVARGLGLFRTSPNSLVHLTTIVRPVANECLLASRKMPNGITEQIVSDRSIS